MQCQTRLNKKMQTQNPEFTVSSTTQYTFKSPKFIEQELLRILDNLAEDYKDDYSESVNDSFNEMMKFGR